MLAQTPTTRINWKGEAEIQRIRNEKIPIIQIIKYHFPAEVSEFTAAPWDYMQLTSDDLDTDAARVTVILHVGKEKREKTFVFRVYFNILKVWVERTR